MNIRKKILVLFGTRPEAIKLFPVIDELKKENAVFNTVAVTTGQHREMLADTLSVFSFVPDHHLDVMTEGQDLFDVSTRILNGLRTVYKREKPDLVICQGDTTTTYMSALAAFYMRINVAHVEAGLRSGDILNPYPEEANRRSVSILARYNFAPTDAARDNLLAEGVPANRIFVTGNTVIDALYKILEKRKPLPPEVQFDESKKMVLITFHRRESFGRPIREMCAAIAELATAYPDVEWVFPVHLNPNVKNVVYPALADAKNVRLLAPQPYDVFASLLYRAYMVLSDSGGVQEEAAALGKPVLVLRRKTERPEILDAGTGRLIGLKKENIVRHASELLADTDVYRKMAKKNTVFGDGRAAKRIVTLLKKEK